MAKKDTSPLFDDIHSVAALAGTKFWDAVMGTAPQLAALGPAVSNPSPTVVIGGEAHIHVDDRQRCEDECLDCEHDVDGCAD